MITEKSLTNGRWWSHTLRESCCVTSRIRELTGRKVGLKRKGALSSDSNRPDCLHYGVHRLSETTNTFTKMIRLLYYPSI